MTELILSSVRGVKVCAAEGGEPGDGSARTVAGLAVQYGVVGRVSNGWLVRFEAGSLGDPESVKLRRDHEYPIGLVSSWKDDEAGRWIVANISRFARGDEALALAADGVLDSLSVGVNPTEYSFEASDEHAGEEVLVVHKGEWRETSLVEFGAFPGAKVTKVAASAVLTNPRPTGALVGERGPELITINAPAGTDPDAVVASIRKFEQRNGGPIAASTTTKEAPVPDTQTTPVEAAAPAPDNTPALIDKIEALVGSVDSLITAQAEQAAKPVVLTPTPTVVAGSKFRNIGAFTFAFLKAQKGDEACKARIEAALKTALTPELGIEAALDKTTTALNTGLIPPVYTTEVLGGLPVSTPILDNLVRHAALPATGMSMIKPRWSVLPEGDWISTENTEPASDAVAVTTETINVLTWGHAVKASINLLERSAFGGFAQNYFDQTRISYLSDLEARAKTEMYTAADSIVATDIDDPLECIAQLVEYCIENQRDANGNFRGLAPDFVGCSANQFGRLVQTSSFLPFAQGSASWGTMMGMVAGITVVLLPSLNQGDYLAGARAATVVYDDTPVELRATVVNTMSVELGVIANTAVDVEYPDALVKITFGS